MSLDGWIVTSFKLVTYGRWKKVKNSNDAEGRTMEKPAHGFLTEQFKKICGLLHCVLKSDHLAWA